MVGAMPEAYRVQALWDPKAKVWVSTSDVPGLVIETATLTEFEALMRALIPELVERIGVRGGSISVEFEASGAFELIG